MFTYGFHPKFLQGNHTLKHIHLILNLGYDPMDYLQKKIQGCA